MEYLELQSILLNDSEPNDTIDITDIEEKNNRIYFKVNGFLFCTYGNWIYHEKHPLFSHVVSDIIAKRHNTAEGIAEEQKMHEESDKKFDLFMKHRTSLFKILFIMSIEILGKKGDEAFINFLDRHFDIMENNNSCQYLLQKLEKTDNNESET